MESIDDDTRPDPVVADLLSSAIRLFIADLVELELVRVTRKDDAPARGIVDQIEGEPPPGRPAA
jgi:hypothetical protein